MRALVISVMNLFILLIVGCNPSPPVKNTAIKTTPVPVKKEKRISLPDTLTKYEGTDSLYTGEHGSFFYSGTANKVYFAIVCANDTMIHFFQKLNDNWLLTDSTRLYAFWTSDFVRTEDINGDRYKDIVITRDVTAAGGNAEQTVFAYDPVLKKFRHHSSYDLSNIGYDRHSRKVHSSWWGSVTNPQTKMTYKVTGDSLSFEDGIRYIPNSYSPDSTAEINYYHMSNREEIIYKSIKGNPEKLWRIFELALWDSRNEY